MKQPTTKVGTRARIMRAILQLKGSALQSRASALAIHTKLTVSTVRKHLQELREEGLVVTADDGNGGYLYDLAPGAVIPRPVPRKRAPKVVPVQAPEVAPVTEPVAVQEPLTPEAQVLCLIERPLGVHELGVATRIPRPKLQAMLDALVLGGLLAKGKQGGRAIYSRAS